VNPRLPSATETFLSFLTIMVGILYSYLRRLKIGEGFIPV